MIWVWDQVGYGDHEASDGAFMFLISIIQQDLLGVNVGDVNIGDVRHL